MKPFLLLFLFAAAAAFLLLIPAAAAVPPPQERTPLHMLFLHTKALGTNDDLGRLPALDFAVDLINANPKILPNFQLEIVKRWTRYELSRQLVRTLRGFIDDVSMTTSNVTYVMVLGPEFSSEAQVLAELAPTYNLIILSNSATSPALSDKIKYPMFARVVPSTDANADAAFALLKKLNYTKVALVFENDPFSRDMANKIEAVSVEHRIELLVNREFLDESSRQTTLTAITKRDARIIVAISLGPLLGRLICDAYKKNNMSSEKYLWIVAYTSYPNWWIFNETDPENGSSCTRAEMSRALGGSLTLQQAGLDTTTPNSERIYNLTLQQYRTELERRMRVDYNVRGPPSTYQYHANVHHTFDMVWAAALGMHAAQEKILLSKNLTCRSLECFTYNEADMGQIMLRALLNVSFVGATGPVQFKANGDRLGIVQIFQFRFGFSSGRGEKNDEDLTSVGFYHESANNGTVKNKVPISLEALKFYTLSGDPPPDSAPDAAAGALSTSTIALLTGALAIVFIIICVAALFFINYTRRQRYLSELRAMQWQVDIDEVKIVLFNVNNRNKSTSSGSIFAVGAAAADNVSRRGSILSSATVTVFDDDKKNRKGRAGISAQPLIAAMYRGQPVSLIELSTASSGSSSARKNSSASATFSTANVIEIKQVKDAIHDNLARFVGVAFSKPSSSTTADIFLNGSSNTTGGGGGFVLWQGIQKATLSKLITSSSSMNEVKLDWDFRWSLLSDCAAGLQYLQEQTPIGVHGRLRPQACIVDHRFLCKLADFGLPRLRASYYHCNLLFPPTPDAATTNAAAAAPAADGEGAKITTAVNDGDSQRFGHLLYSAPELLQQLFENPSQDEQIHMVEKHENFQQNNDNTLLRITRTDDVYSFGVIVWEMTTRKQAFIHSDDDDNFGDDGQTTATDIRKLLYNVAQGTVSLTATTGSGEKASGATTDVDGGSPPLPCPASVVSLMNDCLSFLGPLRPTIDDVVRRLKLIGREAFGVDARNLMDTLVKRLALYATNLESLVRARTDELVEEKHRSEQLLYSILPQSVADKLKLGQTVEAEFFDSVSIYFSDIVGKRTLRCTMSVRKVVEARMCGKYEGLE